MLEDGKYTARAVEAKLGYTANGKEQVAVLFDITGPNGEVVSRTWYGYFTEKTWERTLESLRFCGWKSDDLNDMTGLGDNEVQVVLQTQEYNGNYNQRIAFVNQLGGGSRGGVSLKAEMDPQQSRSFAESFKSRIREFNALKAAGGHPKPVGNAAPPAAVTDDIPF